MTIEEMRSRLRQLNAKIDVDGLKPEEIRLLYNNQALAKKIDRSNAHQLLAQLKKGHGGTQGIEELPEDNEMPGLT